MSPGKASPSTDDVRIDNLRPLLPPAILMEEIALDADQATRVATARDEIAAVIDTLQNLGAISLEGEHVKWFR